MRPALLSLAVAAVFAGCSSPGGGGGTGGGSGSTGGGSGSTGGGSGSTGGGNGGGSAAGAFRFLVYGDSRAGSNCSGNQVHAALVTRMAQEPADLVLHVGDMITGYNNNTNWLSDGACTSPGSRGSFKQLIAPLQTKAPRGALPAFFFPVIGNHDDNWGSGWYPDPQGNGVCDAFPRSLVDALVPNHTQQAYFRDKSGSNYTLLTDTAFHDQLCATTRSQSYPAFFYYSFDHQGVHFVVLRVNDDYFDLAECGNCSGNLANYNDYYNIHQLDWLKADLAAARANPNVQHIFAFLHAPLFSSSWGHTATTASPAITAELSRYGVVAAFSGHNHIYERTVRVRVDAANPAGVRDDTAGTTYVTTGGGGSDLHGFNPAGWFDAVRVGAHHYTSVAVNGSQVDLTAIDSTGAVIDSVRLAP